MNLPIAPDRFEFLLKISESVKRLDPIVSKKKGGLNHYVNHILKQFSWWYISGRERAVFHTSRMHWWARRTCLTICFKCNRGVLWQEDWGTQRIPDSYVCPFGLATQRPTRVAEDIKVRQKRDLRRLWLELWPIKPSCPADPQLSESLLKQLISVILAHLAT